MLMQLKKKLKQLVQIRQTKSMQQVNIFMKYILSMTQ